MSKFTIVAAPETDIWRKPPSTNRFNAPTKSLLSRGPVPLSLFQRARITFNANWTSLYDHGGLFLHLTNANGSTDRWMKTGIEYFQGRPNLATVATQTYADFSVYPIDGNKATIEVRREGQKASEGVNGSLWVYQIVKGADGGEQRTPLREITWFFAEQDGWSIDVKAMAARCAKEEDVVGPSKDLVIEFEDAEVEIQ